MNKNFKLFLISLSVIVVITISLFLFFDLRTNDSFTKFAIKDYYERIITSIGDKFFTDYLSYDTFLKDLLVEDMKDYEKGLQNRKSLVSQINALNWIGDKIYTFPPNYNNIINSVKLEKINYKIDQSEVEIKTSEIYKRNKSATVIIYLLDDKDFVSYGSGFVISSNGIIATNNHVISDKGDENTTRENLKIGVAFPETKEVFEVDSVIAKDEEKDLAIIKIKGGKKIFSTVSFSGKDSLEIGDSIVTIGSPLYSPNTILDGIVSSIRIHEVSKINNLQVSIPTGEGNSGGPVFDNKGHVVAVYFAKKDINPNLQNFNYAIPVNYLIEMMDRINK